MLARASTPRAVDDPHSSASSLGRSRGCCARTYACARRSTSDLSSGDDWLDPHDGYSWRDIAAVKMLGVTVPARAALRLTGCIDETFASDLEAQLSSSSPDIEPQDPAGQTLLRDTTSPLHQAWRQLRTLDGVGWVIASKLLARKRPHIAPIYDRVVRAAVGAPPSWWTCVADYFTGPERVARLDQARHAAGQADLPLLRALDVAVWEQARYGRPPLDPLNR